MTTYTWVGGTGTWDTVNTAVWSPAGVPTGADDVVFNSATTYTVTMTGALVCQNFTVSAGTVTFATGVSPTLNFQGNMSLVAGTVWNSTGTITIDTFGTKTLTTNGTVFNCSIVMSTVGGPIGGQIRQLVDNLTLSSSSTFTVNLNTLDLNNRILTCGAFNSSNSGNRAIAWGSSGRITLSGTGTIWDTSTNTNLTVTGTPVVYATDTSAATRSFLTGSFATIGAAYSPSVYVTGGTGTWSNNSSWYGTFDSTGSSIVRSGSCSVFGNLTLSSTTTSTAGLSVTALRSVSGDTSTKVINLNGSVTDQVLQVGESGVSNGCTYRVDSGGTYGGGGILRGLVFYSGIFDLNGKTITNSYLGSAASVSGTCKLIFNGGTFINTSTGSVVNAQTTAAPFFTTEAGTGTGYIRMTGNSTTKTFSNGRTSNATPQLWDCVVQNEAGSITISGPNTFAGLKNTNTPSTFTFPTGFTTNFATGSAWQLNGTAGNLVTINTPTAGTQAKLSAPLAPDVSGDYLSIRDSYTIGPSLFFAGANSTNVSNNTNWFFTVPAAGAAPLGVQSDSAVGTVDVTTFNYPVVGVESVVSVGTVTVIAPANVPVTGDQSVVAVGTVVATADANAPVTGLVSTGSVGTVTTASLYAVTGVESTGSIGTVTVTGVAVVPVTGVQSTISVGTVTADGYYNVFPTGVQSTGSVGTVDVTGIGNVDAPSVQSLVEVGTVVASIAKTVTVVGVRSTLSVGTVTVSTVKSVPVTGVQSTLSVGTVTAKADVSATVTGVSSTTAVGTVTVTGTGFVFLAGVQSSVQVGTVTVVNGYAVDGVQANGQIGTVSVVGSAFVPVAGVSATGYVSGVYIWTNINPDGDPNWTPIVPSESSSWTEIVPTGSAGWTPLAA